MEFLSSAVRCAFLSAQRAADKPYGAVCVDGSWDPIDPQSFGGGRVFMTAMGTRTLVVFSRFERIKGTEE